MNMPRGAKPKRRRVASPKKRSARQHMPPVSAAPAAVVRPAIPGRIAQQNAPALELFQKGMEALQRHAYKPARETFRALLDRFPNEGALVERTRLYLGLCERELGRRQPNPRTVEERLAVATAALNSADDALAERLVRSVLAEDPGQDLALYLMAVVEARRGEGEAAVSFLTRAATVSPEVRAQARYDSDFEILRHLECYRALIDPPSGPAPRRTRRSLK